MDVALRILGRGEVDHVGEVRDVQPPGGNVGGDENRGPSGAKAVENLLPLGLREVSVERIGFVAPLDQLLGDLLGGQLGSGKDEAVEAVGGVDDPGEGGEFVPLFDLYVELDRLFRSGEVVHHRKVEGVPHEIAGQVADHVGNRRREEEGPSLLPATAENPLHVVDEAHVEHLVGFIEDEPFQTVQQEDASGEVVDHPAGSSHDDVHPFVEATDLFVQGDASVDGGDRHSPGPLQRVELFGDLKGQLPGGCQNQGLDITWVFVDLFQDGKAEGGRFSRSCLGPSDQVPVAEKEGGDDLLLNGGREFETFTKDSLNRGVGESEKTEPLP